MDVHLPVDLYVLRMDVLLDDDPINLMLSLLSCENPSLCVGELLLSPFIFSLSTFLFLFLLPSFFGYTILDISLYASSEIRGKVMHDLNNDCAASGAHLM